MDNRNTVANALRAILQAYEWDIRRARYLQGTMDEKEKRKEFVLKQRTGEILNIINQEKENYARQKNARTRG